MTTNKEKVEEYLDRLAERESILLETGPYAPGEELPKEAKRAAAAWTRDVVERGEQREMEL